MTLCATSVVAHASLGCTTSLTISLFQFCAQWINEHIFIAIILNEDDTIFRMAFSNIASILTFSCSGLNGTSLKSQRYKSEEQPPSTDILVSKDNTSST